MKPGAVATMVLCLVLWRGIAGAETLITLQEAELPAAAAPADTTASTRALTRPPVAELVRPAGGKDTRSPTPFTVKFTAYGGTTIDAAATKVFYLKNPLVELTPRLAKYIKPSGIEMPEAEVPPGEHAILIELVASNGHTGSSVVTFRVGR